MTRNYVFLLGLGLLMHTMVLFQISGCGGDGGGGNIPAIKAGTLRVGITDAPPAGQSFTSVHITVNKVVVVPDGKEDAPDNDASLPVIATFPAGLPVDILDLHFVPQILGSAIIPAGSYSQVRLILASNQGGTNNYVTLSGNPTEKLPLTTPSAQQTGLKIVGKFTVTAGVINAILLDFDPNTAIVFAGNSGNINLKPTGIRIVQVFNSLVNAGSVTGSILSPQFRPWSSATITVEPRSPAAGPVASGVVFSNFSSPGTWRGPFTAFVPPSGSASVPSANYRLFVQAYSHTTAVGPVFKLYSSPPFTITSGVDTPVPPAGVVTLLP
jgi:hypothetical protein